MEDNQGVVIHKPALPDCQKYFTARGMQYALLLHGTDIESAMGILSSGFDPTCRKRDLYHPSPSIRSGKSPQACYDMQDYLTPDWGMGLTLCKICGEEIR
eukprot:6007777-Prymnesium_polylepis.1